MSDELDQHPSLREHLGLRERVTVLEGGQANIIQMLNRIETRQLASSVTPAQPPVDHIALIVQRAMDSMERKQSGNGIGHSILITLAIIGVGVTAFVVGKVFF